jgi:hypothetical protein
MAKRANVTGDPSPLPGDYAALAIEPEDLSPQPPESPQHKAKSGREQANPAKPSARGGTIELNRFAHLSKIDTSEDDFFFRSGSSSSKFTPMPFGSRLPVAEPERAWNRSIMFARSVRRRPGFGRFIVRVDLARRNAGASKPDPATRAFVGLLPVRRGMVQDLARCNFLSEGFYATAASSTTPERPQGFVKSALVFTCGPIVCCG